MKKVFVTGAAGFVGSHLIPILTKSGYSPTGLVKNLEDKKLVHENIKVIVGDLSKRGQWQNKLKGYDTVIHLAAEIASKDPKSFEINNVIATKNLIVSAKKNKVKNIILFSSAAVTSIRQDEYARTKMEQEALVKASKLKYVILRPSMIYGPNDTKNVGWLIKFVKHSPIIPLFGGGEYGRQPVYVEDICKIVLMLLKKDFPRKIYEIHGFEYISLAKMIKFIIKNLKTKRIIISVPIPFLVLIISLGQKILPSPKFTVDQIESLTSGEKFSGDKWWNTFHVNPTKFEVGLKEMLKEK